MKSLIACLLATTWMMVVPLVQAREFHATVDFNDDFRKAGGPVKPENVDNLMARFAELGIRRVYWIHNAEDFYLPRPLTDLKVDLVECAVEAAHRHGMKLYALYKPFETGHHTAFPGDPRSPLTLERIGHFPLLLAPFVEAHPQYRIQRRPVGAWQDRAIGTIKLVKSDAKPTRLRKEHLRILTSAKNGDFESHEVGLEFRDALEDRDGQTVRVLTLSRLNIPASQRYVMVLSTLKDAQGDFRNQEDRLIEIYDSKGELIPATVDEGCSQADRKAGFYFDAGYYSASLRTLDGNRGRRDGVVVVAKGKNPYTTGALHPIYPQVRKYWLDEVRNRCIRAGVDGVSIRITNHSGWTSEGAMHGFNPPVVAEYQRRWGVDILTEPFDVEKWKQLQGEYFTLFLRELKQELARHRLPLQVSVNYLMLQELPGWRRNNVPENFAYEWEKWIAEDIADSIELKYIPWRWGAYRGRGEELIEQIAGLARKHNKPVFTNVRFESRIPLWEVQANGKPAISPQDERLAGLRDDLRRAWNNTLLDGVILYEGAGFTRMDRKTGETLVAPFVKDLLDDVRRPDEER